MNQIKLRLTIEKTFFIFALMLFASCIYEPFEIYENPVNTNPSVPQINNLELNVIADTLWVYGDQILKYHFKSSNDKQRILGLKIYIDGVICDSTMSDNGEFNILHSALSEGIHKMNILLYTKSGTGSIADRLNAEAILLTKEWVVVANYSKKNVTYTIENGYLKLQWEQYKNFDLKSYKIEYSGSTQNNYFIDTLYCGGKRTFNIVVEKANGDILEWGSLDMVQNIAKPELKVTDDNKYYFTWRKSPYYKALKYQYSLYNSEDNRNTNGFKSGSDTVYVPNNLYFCDFFSFGLTSLPKHINENTNDYMIYPCSSMTKYAGEPAGIKGNTYYTSADTLTSFDAKNVYKYLINGETVYSQPIHPATPSGFAVLQFSPRGKYLLGIVYGSVNTEMKYFAKDLSTGHIYYMDYVYPGYYESYYYLSMHISDNGIGIFVLPNKEFLFDFKSNTEIASRNLSSPHTSSFLFKIAPDGKHVMSSNYSENAVVNVFKINSSSLEKMYSIESTSSNWQFNPIDPNMITTINNKTLSVIQCEPYALLRTIEFASDEAFMNIDYFNNEILTINANQFIIRSLTSGSVIKRINKRQEQSYDYENFILHNHHIIRNNVMLKTQ